jgi:hypothetical protein
MPASIGGKQFLTWRGPKVSPLAMAVAEITRSGVDGHAFQQQGYRAPAVGVVTSVDTSSPESLSTQYQALQGTFVTVVNVDGETVANVMVLGVRILSTKKVELAVGGIEAGSWILTAQWELQATE